MPLRLLAPRPLLLETPPCIPSCSAAPPRWCRFARWPGRWVARPDTDKPVEWVLPYPAGGADVVVRKRRPLGATSPKRGKNGETTPTLPGQGLKGFEDLAWQGPVVPAGAPQPVVDPLGKALLAALDTSAVKAPIQTLGREPVPSSPTPWADHPSAGRAQWVPMIRAAGSTRH